MSDRRQDYDQDDGSHRMRVAERYKTNAKYRKLIKMLSLVQVSYICIRTFWNLIPVALRCTYVLNSGKLSHSSIP